MNTATSILSPSQIETYLQNGVLVADNIFTEDEIQAAIDGLHSTFSQEYQIDVHNLLETGHRLCSLSSTNGSGGVLDVFYPDFKLNIGSHPRLFQATTELWKAAYHYDEHALSASFDVIDDDEYCKCHPYGPFDPNRGYMYIDRIGYRLPSQLSLDIANRMIDPTSTIHPSSLPQDGHSRNSKKRKGGIQRCLTPHLDCCPDTFYTTEKKSKWRPIQCFVSFTDNTEPNTGGFEAALGFHKRFHIWAKHRSSTSVHSSSSSSSHTSNNNPLCVGEYTHIRPKEDEAVMKAVQHVPVRKGSVVFFDNRIPHANAYRHTGTSPRVVVYCSFLPDVHINRMYAMKQLKEYHARKIPRDTWINVQEEENAKDCQVSTTNGKSQEFSFSKLGRLLMMMDSWE